MRGSSDRPLIHVEDTGEAAAPIKVAAVPEGRDTAPSAPLIAVEILEANEPVRPEPEAASLLHVGPTDGTHQEGRSGWLVWAVAAGVVIVALAGTVDWVFDLLVRLPVLGGVAAVGATLLTAGLIGLGWREIIALRRLHDVRRVRVDIETADGEKLRRLLLQIGADISAIPIARLAAEAVEDQGPEAARRILSRDALAPLDRRAAIAVGVAARQGFVMVTVSPSISLDSVLLMVRAARLVREIAAIYGYRPSALTLRSLAFAASRDAGAVAVANILTEGVAQATARSLEQAGDAMTASGVVAAGSGAGLLVGLPIAAVGAGLSLFGRTVDAAGGAVGGGATAAWRLYRFGLMVLVAARPVPFDNSEMDALRQEARRELTRLAAGREGDQGAAVDRKA